MLTIDWALLTDRVLERCDQLAAISELPDAILRQYLTPEHRRANAQVASWAAQAGLQHWQDEVGNQWLRYPSSATAAKRLILGSHLDTVPNAGRYDGILGVLLGLAVLELLAQTQASLPYHIDVVGFGDEEGTRFGTTLIGSAAIAGQFKPEWLDISDAEGISMRQAMIDFGLDPETVGHAALSADAVHAYLEMHIEQGPVLESQNQALGIVSGIAGAKRAHLRLQGQAGHAGTTPMSLRCDALSAAAELVLAIEALARQCQEGEVATVGQFQAFPGATNVIPGAVELSLDVRALSDRRRDALIQAILEQVYQIEQSRSVTLTLDWTHDAAAVECAPDLQKQIHDIAAQQFGWQLPTLPSGAGHDAMAVAALCPMAMLFIRSPKGLSHHPDEAVIATDVKQALQLFYLIVSELR